MARETKIHRRRRLAAVKGWRTRRANIAARARKLAKQRKTRRIARVSAIVIRRRRPAKRSKSSGRSHQAANRRAGALKRGSRSASTIAQATTRAARGIRRGDPLLISIPASAHGADPLQIQVSATFHLDGAMSPSAALTKEAILYRIEHGVDAPGVTTAIVRWRNPTRLSPKLRAWREGDQGAAWETLGNALRQWCAA